LEPSLYVPPPFGPNVPPMLIFPFRYSLPFHPLFSPPTEAVGRCWCSGLNLFGTIRLFFPDGRPFVPLFMLSPYVFLAFFLQTLVSHRRVLSFIGASPLAPNGLSFFECSFFVDPFPFRPHVFYELFTGRYPFVIVFTRLFFARPLFSLPAKHCFVVIPIPTCPPIFFSTSFPPLFVVFPPVLKSTHPG